jgi:hypothetical protein
MQCKARYCREKKELAFPLRSGYFTELRCGNLALGDGPDPELCEKCQVKASKPFRVACQQGQYQGKVDEPYFEGSWIFGSDRFEKFNAIPGNRLSDEDFARAEAAQKIARQGSEMKSKADPKIKPSSATAAKPRGRPKATNQIISPAPAPAKPTTLPVAVELLDEPLEALEVVKVKVKKIDIEGKLYWLDAKNSEVYETAKGDAVGKKIGNWNTDEEIIEPEFT